MKECDEPAKRDCAFPNHWIPFKARCPPTAT